MINVNKKIIRKYFPFNKIKQFFTGLKSNQEDFVGKASPTLSLFSFGLQNFSPMLINKILMVILSGFIVAVFYSAIHKRLNVEDVILGVSKIKFQGHPEKNIKKFSPITFYQEMVDKRDIFSPFMPAKKEKVIVNPQPVQTKPEPPKIRLSDLAQDFKLVGISWGKIPKALIRSEKDNDTYFVRQGQRIGTSEVRIKKIKKETVVVKYEDQEMEL